MNTNSKQSTGRTHPRAVCRIIGVLFALFAFIWLPTPEVEAALLLISPGCKQTDPDPCHKQTDKVTVFRWTPSENPENRPNHSYRVIFSRDPDFIDDFLVLPTGDEPIIAPQVALDLEGPPVKFPGNNNFYWRVDELDEFGNVVEQSPEPFEFFYQQNNDIGFTVITGLVKSDFNQAALVGARVAVSSAPQALTANSSAKTVFNGEYIVIALTTENNAKIKFPLQITATNAGFRPIVVNDLLDEDDDGVITFPEL